MSTGVAATCMRRNRAAAPTGRRRGGILSEEGEGIEPVPSEEEEETPQSKRRIEPTPLTRFLSTRIQTEIRTPRQKPTTARPNIPRAPTGMKKRKKSKRPTEQLQVSSGAGPTIGTGQSLPGFQNQGACSSLGMSSKKNIWPH
jgi:hypothetical protein